MRLFSTGFDTRNIMAGIALLTLGAGVASATTIVDGTFSNWAFGGVGNGSMALDASNGNAAPGVNVTTTTLLLPGVFVYGTGIDLNVSTVDALSGAFSLALDVKSGAGDFGNGQAVSLLLKQGNDVYSDILGTTNNPGSSFVTLTFNGNFGGTFTHLTGSGAALPVLTGGTTTYFGFAGINSDNGRTLTEYYDNFNFNANANFSATSPEPSTMALFGSAPGLLVAILMATRKRRSALAGSHLK